MTGIRSMNEIDIFDPSGRFLHRALQDALGAGTVHFDFNAFIFVLKIMRDCRRRRNRKGGVPNHLGFLARRLDQRCILPRNQRRKSANASEHDEADTDLFHTAS